MKNTIVTTIIGTVLPTMVFAQGEGKLQIRDAATHEQLSISYRKAQQEDPMAKLKETTGNDPSIVNLPQDLMSSSDIICFGGAATLVPKRAMLNMPAKMQERMQFVPGSKLMSWADFFAVNRGWISTVEVSREQAEGNKAMDEATTERIGKSQNLVIATYKGGPISVLPLKVEEKPETTEPES